MEPRIQYAKTDDWVCIAYTVMQSGPVLILPSDRRHQDYRSAGGS